MLASGNFATTVALRIAAKTRQLTHTVFDSYRPELHYMRGPGPKWRQKHGQPEIAENSRQLDLLNLRNAGA